MFLCSLTAVSVSGFCAVIPFKPEMAVELQEKGRVRFWAQVAKFTSNCQVEYVFNDNIITQGKVLQLSPGFCVFVFFSFFCICMCSLSHTLRNVPNFSEIHHEF